MFESFAGFGSSSGTGKRPCIIVVDQAIITILKGNTRTPIENYSDLNGNCCCLPYGGKKGKRTV